MTSMHFSKRSVTDPLFNVILKLVKRAAQMKVLSVALTKGDAYLAWEA